MQVIVRKLHPCAVTKGAAILARNVRRNGAGQFYAGRLVHDTPAYIEASSSNRASSAKSSP